MSGEPAITKIKTRAAAWLTGNVGALVIHTDRKADKPFREAELPCINLRCEQARIIERSYNGDVWECALMFDALTVSSLLSTIDDDQAEAMAAIIDRMRVLSPTPGSLGELLEICEPLSAATQQDEMSLTDLGAATLAYRVVWRAPTNDFRSIAGTTGVLIP